jgi:hypothetical protein
MRLLLCIGLTACVLVSGCGYKGDIVGRWKLDPEFVKKNSFGPEDNYWKGAEHDQRYEFFADHTFKGPLSAGNYTINGGHVELFTTQVRGATVSKKEAQTTADVSRDGKLMTLHTLDDGGLPAAFKNGQPMVQDTGPDVGAPVVRMGGGPGPGASPPMTVSGNSAPLGKKK